MDVNLKEHMKELEKRHTGLEVRNSREELGKVKLQSVGGFLSPTDC